MTSGRIAYGGPALAALALLVVGQAGSPSVPPAATEMTVAGRATVRGRVTLEGPAPDVTALDRDFQAARARHRDRGVYAKAPPEENEQQTWRIGAEGGVGNVIVWLRPADGSNFVMARDDLHPKTRTWAEEVVVTLPYLNFAPHVVVLFPSHFDPATKKQVPTGQAFKVVNDSRVAFCLRADGDVENPSEAHLLPARGEVKLEMKPSRRPVVLGAHIHPWMRGYAWVFDHPYAAVTDRTGRYEIRRAPAGVAVCLMAWHEEVGYLYGRNGIALELKDGDNRKDLRLRPGR
jgi:hypothetical protein